MKTQIDKYDDTIHTCVCELIARIDARENALRNSNARTRHAHALRTHDALRVKLYDAISHDTRTEQTMIIATHEQSKRNAND